MGNIAPPLKAVIVLNILLLEDSDDDALLVERALSGTGYVYSLKRARDMAEFIAQLDPALDLILSDYHLSDCNALDALDQLKERGLDIPLILMSGRARDEDAIEAIKRGAADFLSKDRLGRLGPAIAATLERRALRQQAHDIQQALEHNREELDYAFDTAAIGIALTSLDGRWLKVNQALCRITGYTEPGLLATDCHSITHQEDIAGDIDLIKQLVAGEVNSTQREKRYVHQLGHVVWVQVTASLVRDRDGTPRHRMLQVLDITHRKEAEERFQATFNQAAVGIAHTATDGKFLIVNSRLCEILGYSRDELLQKTALELSVPSERGQYAALYQEVTDGKRTGFSGEKRWVRKDGSVIWVNRTVSRAAGAVEEGPYLIQVIEDITERKRTEERLERANRARRVLAECSRAMVHGSSEEELLQKMCRIVVKSGAYVQAYIGFAQDDEQKSVRPVASAGFEEGYLEQAKRSWASGGRQQSVMGRVIANGRSYISRDIFTDPNLSSYVERARQRGYQSLICLPLKVEGRCIGGISIYAREADAFDEEEIALLATLADDIAFGIAGLRTRVARQSAEAALRESEQRSRETFEQAAVGITHVDLNGVLVDVNQKFCDMLGYAKSELLGKTVKDITHPDDYGRGSQYRKQLAHGASKAMSGEKRFLRKDGTIMWARRTMSPACDDAGNPQYLISVVEDITARKEIERRFELTFNHAGVGMTQSSLDGHFLQVNQKFADMLGYTREELLGMTSEEVTHPDDRAETGQLRQKLLSRQVEGVSSEKRLVRKDGRVIWVNRTFSVARGASGEPLYFIAVVDDITERKELERRYRETFDQAAVGIVHTAIDGRYLRANQKFCEMLGYSESELAGRPVADFAHPEDREKGRHQRQLLWEGKLDKFSEEKRYIRKDGGTIWTNRTVSLARDESGKPLYFIRVIEDISERKEAEERYRATFDNAPIGIMHTEIDTYKILHANPKLCEMLGYTLDELQGMTSTDVVHPDYRFSDKSKYKEQILSGESQSFVSERKFIRKDGSTVWVNRTVSLVRDAAGKPLYFIRIIEDISERKQAEEARRASEETLRATFEQAAVGMALRDVDPRNPRWLRVNQKLCDILGYTREELLQLTSVDITPPEERDLAVDYNEQLLRGEIESYSREKRYVRKDGKIIWADISLAAVRGLDDRPTHIISVIQDITARKRAEAALRESEERYRDVFEASPLPMWVWDDETLRFLAVNAATVDHYGYTQDEFLRMNVRDIWAPGEQARYEENIRDRARDQILHLQRKHRTKDGRIIDVEVTARQFMRGGHPVWLTLVNDISERKQAEEALRTSEETLRDTNERLQMLIESSPLAIYARDTDGRLTSWNPAAEKMYGWKASEVLGKPLPSVSDESRAESDGLRMRLLAGEPFIKHEARRRRRDGSPIDIDASLGPLRDHSGNVTGIIAVVADITERTSSARSRTMEHAVTRVLSESATLDDAMPAILQTICEGLGWACGAHWQWDDKSEMLRCVKTWHVDSEEVAEFIAASRHTINEAPAWHDGAPKTKTGGLVRSVWFSGTPVWLPDAAQQPGFRRGPIAAKAGLHCAFGFPVLAGAQPLGVMEFYSRDIKQPDEALLQVVRAIGSQIGQFIQRKQAEAALRESEEQFRQLAGNIPQVFWITDVTQKQVIYVSPASEQLLGVPVDALQANPRKLVQAVHRDDRPRVLKARKSAALGEYDETYRVVRPDGSIRWVHERAFPVHDDSGTVYRIAGIAEDVTDRKLAEERLMQLAHYDVLTSLPNRVLFYDRLKQALAQSKRNQWITGVMFIDVDRFKNVNDTLGHAVGDQLLQQISERLTRSVRTGDTVGRLGGDEFAIVLSNLSSAQDTNLVAQKIMANFNEPFKLEGSEIYVTASIGITLYPDDSTEQDTLIKNADAAMYRAKEAGRNNFQFYTPEMNARALEILNMENSLRHALDRNELLLYYQPKTSVADGNIVGVEALLRWQHPERGLVSPVEFIPVLEESGLIVPVGEWVLRTVCAQIKAWERAGVATVPVAVNLSARQFTAKGLGPTIQRILEEYQVDPALIELEITESCIMANAEEATRTLEYLEHVGVGLSIDDFGTGYSSLGYLKRFPLDALKIDHSFVRDLTTDADDATITRAVISMAHSLGLKVIAEGVETESQLAFLAEYGCDEIQGYYFSRPLAAQECGTWLGEKRRLQRPRQVVDSDTLIVLLVDDDDDALTLLKRSLGRDGYRILAARNAHEALELLGQHHVDVVISDQKMPGIPGVEFLQRVKSLFPKTIRMMTSNYTDFQTMTDAVNKGEIFRFLPKNLSEEELRIGVREALRARADAAVNIGHLVTPGTVGK